MFDPLTLLAGLIPVATEAGKALVQRYLAPDQIRPTSVSEYIQLKQADIELFKAINDAGGNNPSYPWVEAIIRLQRPFIAALTMITWAIMHNIAKTPVDLANLTNIDNAAAAISFYLFADRTLFYIRKGSGKGG